VEQYGRACAAPSLVGTHCPFVDTLIVELSCKIPGGSDGAVLDLGQSAGIIWSPSIVDRYGSSMLHRCIGGLEEYGELTDTD
jgi:hypothetical protein